MSLPATNILIEANELIETYQLPNNVIIDCRFYLDDTSKGRKEYLISHIPNAVYLDIANDLSSPVIKGVTGRHPLPDPAILSATFRAAGLHNDSTVIVYDQSNAVYASRSWWLLYWLGHRNIRVLNGGFNSWLAVNGLLDNQWTLPEKGTFVEHRNDQLTTDRFQLLNLKNQIVDSRDYKRYTGEIEPIDPVAGHIPGAICIPYLDNTNNEGIWKTRDELNAKFAEINASTSPVFYCGSGVTACHNILAYKIATGKDALLYPGSWSEWINYHTTPATKHSA